MLKFWVSVILLILKRHLPWFCKKKFCLHLSPNYWYEVMLGRISEGLEIVCAMLKTELFTANW
jgi:hypothetical protein